MKKILAMMICVFVSAFLCACAEHGNEKKPETYCPDMLRAGPMEISGKKTIVQNSNSTENKKTKKAAALTGEELEEVLLLNGFMYEDDFEDEFGYMTEKELIFYLNQENKLGCLYTDEIEVYDKRVERGTVFGLENFLSGYWSDVLLYECADESAKSFLEEAIEEANVDRENVWIKREKGSDFESVVIQEQILHHAVEDYIAVSILCRVDDSVLFFQCPAELKYSNAEIDILKKISYLNMDIVEKKPEPRLSAESDYVLCAGRDYEGNYYELLATQEESSRGFKIEMGITKNNRWLYPMSADFPFISDDGLVHVSVSLAGESGNSLSNDGQANEIIQNLYFSRDGAFLLDSYTESEISLKSYDHYQVLFSLDSLKSYTLDCDKYSIESEMYETDFYQGDVLNYGTVYFGGDKAVLTETHRNSVYQNDDTYSVYLLDLHSFEKTPVKENCDIYPIGVCSEDLIMFSDHRFYNTEGKKMVDLSDFEFESLKNACYINGEYEFVAKNIVGSKFYVIVDVQGNILSENKIS